jgi:hypothetical protein
MQANHTFSIENVINEETGQPFGSKYAGAFTIRRPSFADQKAIELKNAASMAAYGNVPSDMIGDGTKLLSYVVIFVQTIAVGPLPQWFDLDQMFDDCDELAVYAVWEEVQRFRESFRPNNSGSRSSDRSADPPVLVPEQV